ncbi:MAG: DUF2585 family protein [Oligoflexia bacterium]|nr:DUF2585 family protein [Oligoflexia bacterium]
MTDNKQSTPNRLQANVSQVSMAGLLICALLVCVLRLLGRTWWCSCGELAVWAWDVNSRHNSQHIVDWYSFSHVLHGVIFYWLLWLLFRGKSLALRLLAAMAIEASWEIAENSPFIIERYRSATIALNYYGDSILNSLSDVGMCCFGFYLAARLSVRTSIILFVAVELFLLVMIRDNLTLNVLMLLWPIDSIKAWQSMS